MHKSLNRFAFAGFGLALAIAPATLSAKDEATAQPAQQAAPASSEQQAKMQSWPADKQAAFKAWPAETQAYFWSLSEERQAMFWALSDGDKVSLSKMAEPQRESVWAQIESRSRTGQPGSTSAAQ